MADLLPCPFCGGAAELRPQTGYWSSGGTWVSPVPTCTSCRARAPSPILASDPAPIDAWNRRAAFTASPAGDDPKALDAEARSSSTEAVEQEVERLRKATETAAIDLECIATAIRHGYEAQAAVDAEMSASRLRVALVPAACKPEGETHG